MAPNTSAIITTIGSGVLVYCVVENFKKGAKQQVEEVVGMIIVADFSSVTLRSTKSAYNMRLWEVITSILSSLGAIKDHEIYPKIYRLVNGNVDARLAPGYSLVLLE